VTPDELATVLCQRMLTGTPVWVDSEAGQRVTITAVGREEYSYSPIAYDHEGNDRLVTEYLLTNPCRPESGPS